MKCYSQMCEYNSYAYGCVLAENIRWEKCTKMKVKKTEKPEKQKPQTNADHIRSMSDEELADKITDYINTCPVDIFTDCKVNCKACWLKWLKQPYKENTDDCHCKSIRLVLINQGKQISHERGYLYANRRADTDSD